MTKKKDVSDILFYVADFAFDPDKKKKPKGKKKKTAFDMSGMDKALPVSSTKVV